MRTSQRTAQTPARTLRADSPAELLAEARMAMGAVARDCLILIGHAGRRSSPVVTRIPLEDRGGPQAELVDGLLEQMARQGCTGAFGLVVLGDGYERGPREADVAEAIGWCALVLATASERTPHPFDIPELWVLAHERAIDVLLRPVPDPGGGDEPSFDLAIGPPEVLPPLDSTLVAAQAVAEGRTLPAARPEVDVALEDARPRIAALRGRLPAPPLELAWERSLAALARLAGGAHRPGSDEHMTDCEHVAAFLDLCDAVDAIDTLLTLAFPSHRGLELSPGAGIDVMLTDPTARPHQRICAGGHWYEGLGTLRRLARDPHGSGGPGHADQAWVSLSCVLAVLAWWNQRYATAAELAQEVLADLPDHGLALCLDQMTMAPIRPAWHARP